MSEIIIGHSPAVRQALALAWRFARTDLPVLLVGETGTGKELFAQEIHRWSGRSGAFVDVNCGALPRDMVEGILFGHRRGAFTGAHETTPGLVETADRGTLLLDELPSLPLEAQAKLLRVLETKQFRRLGDATNRAVEFRVVATAQPEPSGRVSSGALRLDLFQRLAGVVVTLPPLRERSQDLAVLASHFATTCHKRIASDVSFELVRHPWFGNVRELRTAIARAAAIADGDCLSAAHVAEAIALGTVNGDRQSASKPVLRRSELLAQLKANGGDVNAVAAALGVSRSTVYRWLKVAGP